VVGDGEKQKEPSVQLAMYRASSFLWARIPFTISVRVFSNIVAGGGGALAFL
jgi:hypothetical protein